MEKVYLIGDCHAARVSEHWNPKTCLVDYKVWGKHGTYAWKFDPKSLADSNMVSTGVETHSLYVPEDRLQMNFADIKDDGLIQVWIGYVDIRQLLPEHKDAKACVYKYLDTVLEYFPNSKIQVIEPLPQFTEMLLKKTGISPEYTYEERQTQNKNFCEAINEYSVSHNLEKVITQQQIKDAVGLQEFRTEHTPLDRPHPIDSLRQEYFAHIYNLFLEESYNVFGIK
jgi:hypothetical protein